MKSNLVAVVFLVTLMSVSFVRAEGGVEGGVEGGASIAECPEFIDGSVWFLGLPTEEVVDLEEVTDIEVMPVDEEVVGDVVVTDVADSGDVTDGEATDGEATDGEATDGEATDGEATDGEVADGEATDGEATDGEATDGEEVVVEDDDVQLLPIEWIKRGNEDDELLNPVICYFMAGGPAATAVADGSLNSESRDLGQYDKAAEIEAKANLAAPSFGSQKKGPVAVVKKGRVFLR
jgi:hypothetical protein